jgi:hypothetical protein
MIGDCRDDAINVLVVEKFSITPSDGEIRPDNLSRQNVSAVVEISRGRTDNPRKLDGLGEQPGSLHANADHSEADLVTCSDRSLRGKKWLGG